MRLKKYRHNPAHLFNDDAPYFITGVIYLKRPLLRESKTKYRLLADIHNAFADYAWELHHWVILDNHYHLLGKSRKGGDLIKIIRKIHGKSGYFIKQTTKSSDRVWWNYWDYCPRDEDDYFRHLNYLFHNPIKHGYVTDLKDYPYSSFLAYLETQGREALAMQFRRFSEYKDLLIDEDNF